ncbi:hypothetical protein KKI23_00495 [Patescibacteria group bacterium]|nr:hypothetical protein [Patescibacteria group bacterium]
MIHQLNKGDKLVLSSMVTSVDAVYTPGQVVTMMRGTRCQVHNPQRVVCWDPERCHWVDGITITLSQEVAAELEAPVGPYLVPLEHWSPDRD